VCADTLRSVAVLIAASVAWFVPGVPGNMADSVAAVVVSVIILGSLLPLIQGLVYTVVQIFVRTRNPPVVPPSLVLVV
jgi:Co/Zn/Cd efflux system component